jgi:hypothetical protein
MLTDVSAARWRRSSYSNESGGDCVEVGSGLPGVVPVRDSKVTDGPAVVFPAASFASFLAFVAREDTTC